MPLLHDIINDLLGNADKVDEMFGELSCIDPSGTKQALFDALHGDTSKLASIMYDRAELIARRDLGGV